MTLPRQLPQRWEQSQQSYPERRGSKRVLSTLLIFDILDFGEAGTTVPGEDGLLGREESFRDCCFGGWDTL